MSPDADELAAMVAEVCRFANERIDPRVIDRDHQIPTGLLEELANLGLFGLSTPEEHGGAGLPLAAICEVLIALARRDRSVATTVGLHLGLGTRGLIAFGSEELKARVLPPLATGEHLAAFAATEAGAGSDLRAVATVGVQQGGDLVVDGEKIFVTNGGLAQTFSVLVATPGLGGRRKGFSLVCIDRDRPGVQIGPEEQKLGLRGSSTTTVRFDGVHLGPGDVIGSVGEGLPEAMHVLAWGRTAMAAGCVGAADTALKAASQHVHRRVQFGKTLAQQPVVQRQLADLAALHFAMGAMVHATARITDPVELERHSLATKVFCSEGNWAICDRAIQLHGGAGYIEETGLPLLLRDARITRIFEGANDVLLSLIGTLEATRPTASVDVVGPGAWRAAAFCARVEAHRNQLASTHKMRLLRQPLLLDQLGRLAVLRQSAQCVVEAAKRSASPVAVDLAEHWIQVCQIRARSHFDEIENHASIGRISAFYAKEARP